MQPKVSIGIVLFGVSFLKESLPTLVNQDYENIEFLFRDNSLEGEAKEFIKKHLPEVWKKVKIEAGENIWHSGGHNSLIHKSSGKYYICASSDMLYPSDFVSKAVAILEKPENAQIGSLGVKLKKWDSAWNEKLNVIDSCGIGITKSHKFFDIGNGEEGDKPKFAEEKEVFGVSGALAVYRRNALEDVRMGREFFDEKLHFKNDVDLAYRLQWADWKALYTPAIKCYHARGLDDEKPREKRSSFERGNSFFGQLTTIGKNFSESFSWKVRFLTKLRIKLMKLYAHLFERDLVPKIKNAKKIEQDLKSFSRKMLRKAHPAEIEKLMQ